MCGAELMALPEGVQRVARFLEQQQHPHQVQMLSAAARTSHEAAEQLGILVGQVAKSVVFRRQDPPGHVLVIAAGDRRVDEHKVSAFAGKLGRADAEFVKTCTGFSIGGVSPVAHLQTPLTLIDSSLARFELLWAAAGHPHAVFATTLQQLQELTHAPVVDIAQAL